MLYKELSKGKRMRILFQKSGCQTHLVDECKTSCICSKCGIGRCEKKIVCDNPRSYRTGNILIHRLLYCKNGYGY